MALFSFRHSVKTFSGKCTEADRMAKAGQTEAHIRYITRPAAARVVVAARLPDNDPAITARLFEEKAKDGGGRVCERFVIALPREASQGQREDLAKAFAEALTKRKAGFLFAIHDKAGNDIRNPHLHLVAFDAFERTGGRGRPRSCLGMARKGAIEEAAGLWATTHNELMKSWGFGAESLISSLSFADRGVEQVPTIHEGPGARAMAAKGEAPAPDPAWHHIDQGHTRAEANAVIAEINQARRENDERPHRLGSGDARSADGIGKGGEDGRKDLGGDDRYISAARPPFRRDAESSRGDSEAGFTVSAAAPPPFARSRVAPPAPGRSVAAPFLAGGPAVRVRRRVRRIFWELTMLRDTLRARLAPARTREPVFPFGTAEPQSREAPQRPMKSRRSEIDQREE